MKTGELETTPAGENAACSQCGSLELVEIASQMLCENCIALAGCGCAGHGDDSGE